MERLPQIGVLLRKSQQEDLTRALKNGWCVECEGGCPRGRGAREENRQRWERGCGESRRAGLNSIFMMNPKCISVIYISACALYIITIYIHI